MLLGLLLASQFWLMSDRASFWNADEISDHTTYMLDSKEVAFDSKAIEGKNVLLLVHGFNNGPEDALSTYRLVNTHVSSFKDDYSSRFYDLVIGYLWPGDDSRLEYYDARKHATKLAHTMRSHLELLSSSAARVDILAHSMGNRLVFESLNYLASGSKKVVNNLYSIAAAVDNESLEKGEEYYRSTQNCENIFVFYSQQDEVLKWAYTLAEWDRALGYQGAQDPQDLPGNVKLIDYTNIVGEHSQYFMVTPLYEFMRTQFLLSKI